MPDVFDQLEAPSTGDVFDQLAEPEEPQVMQGLVQPTPRRFSMYDIPALAEKLSESPLPTYGMDVPTVSIPVALAKTVAGLGRGIVSPLGAAATALGPVEAAGPALKAGFGALGAKGLADIAAQQITTPEARAKTIPQAVEFAGQVLPQLAMAGSPLVHAPLLEVPKELQRPVEPLKPIPEAPKAAGKLEREFQLLRENWLPTIKPWRRALLDQEVAEGQGGRNIETNFQDSPGARDVQRAQRYYELARKLYGREPQEEVVTAATYTNPETGETTTGPNHPAAAAEQGVKAPEARESRETPEYGFQVEQPTGKTEVVSRDTAEEVARQSGQLKEEPKGEKVHSDEILSPTEPGKTISEQTPALSDEQLWQKAQRKEKLTPEESKRLDEIESRGDEMGEAETTALQAEADALKQVPPTVSSGEAQPTVPAAGKAEGGVSAPPAPATQEGGISPAKVQVGEKSLGEMTPDEAIKSGADRGDYYRDVEASFRDGKISESQFLERHQDFSGKWPRQKVGEVVWDGYNRQLATVKDIGLGQVNVEAKGVTYKLTPDYAQNARDYAESRIRAKQSLPRELADKFPDLEIPKSVETTTPEQQRRSIGEVSDRPSSTPPTLTPAESTRLKSLTDKLESGKPLTSAEQKRYRALKDKVSPPEGEKPGVEAGGDLGRLVESSTEPYANRELPKFSIPPESSLSEVRGLPFTEPQKEIVDRLVELGYNPKIRVVKDPRLPAASYNGSAGILLNASKLESDPHLAIRGIVHESVHDATHAAIRNPANSTIVERLNALMSYAMKTYYRNRTRFGGQSSTLDHAFKNVDEFVTGAFTSGRVRKVLSQMELSQRTGVKPTPTTASVFGRFMQLVSDLLGLKGKATLLEEVVKSGEELIKSRTKSETPISFDATKIPSSKALEYAPTTPPSRGEGMRGGELQMAVVPGLKEFVEQDLVPFAKKVGQTIGETAQQMKAMAAPPTMGPEAALAAGIVREHKGKLAQTDVQMREKFHKNLKDFDGMSPQASLAFIDRMERGGVQPSTPLHQLQSELRTEFDRRVAQVRALGTGKLQHLIQDYFPHIWKDPDAAVSWYARILGKRPLKGPASFLKRRTIPLTVDGVQAGLEPVSWNPVELSLLKFHEMDRYVMGQRIFQEFKDKGLAQFSRSDIPPAGFARIDDRVANVIEYRPTTKASGAPGAPERILRGHWFVQEDAARVLNNFLSPGLDRYKWFRAIRWIGNTMNMAQLGLSGYHFTFTMIDSGTSKLSLGMEQLAKGELKAGGAKSAQGLVPAVNQLEYYIRGNKVLQEYTKPGSVGAEYAKIVDALIASGGRVEMPRIFRNNSLENFFKAARTGNYPGAIVRAPFAAIEAVSYPLMQNIVPRLKLGVFSDMALAEIEKMGPNVARDEYRARLGKIWDSVDNRMGEMVYDNLFWNRNLKDLSFLAVRAVGWNLGTIRELGGGVMDAATVVSRVRKGDPLVTRRMAYVVALPVTVGIMGAMYQYAKTGQGPQELRDYFYPKTGKMLPDGTPERVNFPSYLKDIASYGMHPFKTLTNKLHPLWSEMAQMFDNKDYYGQQIRNPDDPLVKQVKEELAFVAKNFVPFSVRGAERRAGAKESKEIKAESFFGVMPISPEIARTPAQNKIMEYSRAKAPVGGRTPEEQQRSEFTRDIESQLQGPQDYAKTQQALIQAQREGKLTRSQRLYQLNKLRFERLEMGRGHSKAQAQWLWRFEHLPVDQAQHVYDISTPVEKQLFKRALDLKVRRARQPQPTE